jgi:hypothetical protein
MNFVKNTIIFYNNPIHIVIINSCLRLEDWVFEINIFC